MRLIDAERLKDILYGICVEYETERIHIDRVIDEIDDADDVEVVRCKDCKFFHDKGYCTKITGLTRIKPDDFCSYGERKDNETD